MSSDAPNAPPEARPPTQRASWRDELYRIIFEADTPAGRAFDVVLIVLICVSVFAVALESVESVRATFGPHLRTLEWALTVVFTLEYLVRLLVVPRPLRYATSFFGVVDLVAVLPTYLGLFVPGGQALLTVRGLRILRAFRVLKLANHVQEASVLWTALQAARHKITVFLAVVLTIVVILGSIMYLIEGPENGFTSIPRSVYWAIVTVTTVGYGDIAPRTTAGQLVATVAMIMGYGIIAVPTGIVTVELGRVPRLDVTTRTCPECLTEGHERDARFCKACGARLPDPRAVDAATRPAEGGPR